MPLVSHRRTPGRFSRWWGSDGASIAILARVRKRGSISNGKLYLFFYFAKARESLKLRPPLVICPSLSQTQRLTTVRVFSISSARTSSSSLTITTKAVVLLNNDAHTRTRVHTRAQLFNKIEVSQSSSAFESSHTVYIPLFSSAASRRNDLKYSRFPRRREFGASTSAGVIF